VRVVWTDYLAVVFAFLIGGFSILLGTGMWGAERSFLARVFRWQPSPRVERGLKSTYVFVGVVTIVMGTAVLGLLLFRDLTSA
jgi:hypothetical protein